MPLFYTLPHLCLQYSPHNKQDFVSIYMSLYLCVRGEEKKVKKGENALRELIV